MRQRDLAILATLAVGLVAGRASAQSTGADKSGNWNDSTVWSSGVPTSSSTVYIGSTSYATSATVTLTADESSGNLYLGDGSGTSGTLDLAGHKLSLGNATLSIGQNGSTGTLNEQGGSFSAGGLSIQGANSLTLGSGDVVSTVALQSGASLTTAASTNISGNVNVFGGSTLNLGAALNLGSNTLDVRDSGSVVNMNGHDITANTLDLGYYNSSAVTLDRGAGTPGTLDVGNLGLGNKMVLALISGDTVANVTVAG